MLTDLVLSRCHWLVISRAQAQLRKYLHDQTISRSVVCMYMLALNKVAPDPIKLNDQEVRITVRMDYSARKIMLFLSQFLHAKIVVFV